MPSGGTARPPPGPAGAAAGADPSGSCGDPDDPGRGVSSANIDAPAPGAAPSPRAGHVSASSAANYPLAALLASLGVVVIIVLLLPLRAMPPNLLLMVVEPEPVLPAFRRDPRVRPPSPRHRLHR